MMLLLALICALLSMLCFSASQSPRRANTKQLLRMTGSALVIACLFVCSMVVSLPLAFPMAVLMLMLSALLVGLLRALR